MAADPTRIGLTRERWTSDIAVHVNDSAPSRNVVADKARTLEENNMAFMGIQMK